MADLNRKDTTVTASSNDLWATLRRIGDQMEAKQKRERDAAAEAEAARQEPRVIARYLTVAGAHVDVTYDSPTGWLTATCTGCHHVDRTSTDGLIHDTPEQEQERVEKALPASRAQAQAHAETCRALSTVTA